MNIILLSGGSGKRLWPLSNDIRSKQFIKIFKDGNGGYESMVQRVYRQIKRIDPDAFVTIATGKTQVSAIHNQLGEGVGVSVEPCRRDTFPAIALATAYLHEVCGVGLDEPVIVCPVDPYVNDDYFEELKRLGEQAARGEANLVLMGIEPTYPSEKYGYIIPETKDEIAAVSMFKEKPDAETAKKYIAQGALWNCGVFAYKLGYVLEKAHELTGFGDYQGLSEGYGLLEKVSFDYAVVERESSIQVRRFSGEWKDIGTWNTLTEVMDGNVIGNAVIGDTCEKVYVINELDIPVLCVGLKDISVAASPQGILVSGISQSESIKRYIEQMDNAVMFAEKSWGDYKVLDISGESMTDLVTVKSGHRMNYHSHGRRDEIWNIISGTGRVIIDGMEQRVKPGDVVTMQAGCKHTVVAETELKLVEVQIGRDISVSDKKKYELDVE